MTNNISNSYTIMLEKAKSALKAGDKNTAREWAQKALKGLPDNEELYLILAAVSTPKESMIYLTKALELNPQNKKARDGLRWAIEKGKEEESQKKQNRAQEDTTKLKTRAKQTPSGSLKKTKKKEKKHSSPWAIILFILLVTGGLAWFAWYGMPIFYNSHTSLKDPRPQGVVIKPTLTPTVTPTPTFTPTPIPTSTPVPTATVDKSYVSYFAHSWDIPDQVSGTNSFWVEVDLSEQMVYTYRGDTFLASFLVSTGTSSHPTVKGTYKIYAMYPTYTMIGPGYHLPDVPYSMFFYKGYSLHGTYWHSNFGTPMSHGCVNMRTEDAAWVYQNASIGTYVFVHD
ncbi:MAG: L,D-transpeptidase family protein [Chloroflexi bacterium]|nr:L,D-transpeptidase family protein [Chloroflexota bacterium]